MTFVINVSSIKDLLVNSDVYLILGKDWRLVRQPRDIRLGFDDEEGLQLS